MMYEGSALKEQKSEWSLVKEFAVEALVAVLMTGVYLVVLSAVLP